MRNRLSSCFSLDIIEGNGEVMSLNFKIDETFSISTDPRNFILEKLHDVTSKDTGEIKKVLKDVGYYWTFKGVLNRYVNECLRDLEETDIKLLIDKVDELHNRIEEIGERLIVEVEKVHNYNAL